MHNNPEDSHVNLKSHLEIYNHIRINTDVTIMILFMASGKVILYLLWGQTSSNFAPGLFSRLDLIMILGRGISCYN